MNRREAITSCGGLLAGAWLGGCDLFKSRPGPPEPAVSALIDVHCHLFNGSDLPTVRFIKVVLLHHYPSQGVRTLDIRDEDALDGLIALLTAIVGRTRAPTAKAEMAVLDGQSSALALNSNLPENESAVVEATATFLSQNQFAVAAGISPNAFKTIRSAIFSAAGVQGAAVSDAPVTPPEATVLAQKAYRSNVDLGLVLRWFALFTRYRHVLAEQLADDHTRQGFPPLLLCPAAIDYDRWLGENVDRSPLPAQVSVMGALARRPTGPVVHGYVGFDPLRQAYFRGGIFTDFDPLGLVRRAIREEGFLGVKLYPPMGFRARGNEDAVCQVYPKFVMDDFFQTPPDDPTTAACNPRPANGSVALGRMLDKSMTEMFDLCVAENASVIAHTNNSNESGPEYGSRADPAYWISVFQRWPTLHVCLAHFGHFTVRSAGAPLGVQPPASSWEWTLGRFLKQAGDPPVFADISYLTEISGSDEGGWQAYAGTFRRWIEEFDPECRHLMFGTDWTMLGLDRSYEGYTKRLYAFFRGSLGFDQKRLDRLFFGNAGRFLGLRQGDATRDRLLEFYDRHKVPRSRLPVVATV